MLSAATEAAERFGDWLNASTSPWADLSEALQTWLIDGDGVEAVAADYCIFLQTIIILLGDPNIGLPSGNLTMVSEDGGREALPVIEREKSETPTTPKDWAFVIERELFIKLCYDTQHARRG